MDWLARCIIPEIGKVHERDGNRAEAAHRRAEMGLVAVCEDLAEYWMGMAKADPIPLVCRGSFRHNRESTTRGDVRPRSVGRNRSYESRSLQFWHDLAGACEIQNSVLDDNSAVALTSHHGVIVGLPCVRLRTGTGERDERDGVAV